MLLYIFYMHLHLHDIAPCTILYTDLVFCKTFCIFVVYFLIFLIICCYRLRCIFCDTSQDCRHHQHLESTFFHHHEQSHRIQY
ncbi:uncharacterized protein DS421_12g384860 [Arachis hypogaea]|nr:uncharacterized protein DS421_12g384860 [Arachis hypogaea]